jgi:hypothetical protein
MGGLYALRGFCYTPQSGAGVEVELSEVARVGSESWAERGAGIGERGALRFYFEGVDGTRSGILWNSIRSIDR